MIEKVEVVPDASPRHPWADNEVDPATFSRGVRWMSVRVVRGGKLDDTSPRADDWTRSASSLLSENSLLDSRRRSVHRSWRHPPRSTVPDPGQPIVEALEGARELVPLEAATELNAVIRRVETLTGQLDAIDMDGGRLDNVELELEDIVGPDGDVVDLNERG